MAFQTYKGPTKPNFEFAAARLSYTEEKPEKRILQGSVASDLFRSFFPLKMRENTLHIPALWRMKKCATYPVNFNRMRTATSVGKPCRQSVSYFDYGAAVAMRNLAAAFGIAMQSCLLECEVGVLLSFELDQKCCSLCCSDPGRLPLTY